jgi:hypothetical protein
MSNTLSYANIDACAIFILSCIHYWFALFPGKDEPLENAAIYTVLIIQFKAHATAS